MTLTKQELNGLLRLARFGLDVLDRSGEPLGLRALDIQELAIEVVVVEEVREGFDLFFQDTTGTAAARRVLDAIALEDTL